MLPFLLLVPLVAAILLVAVIGEARYGIARYIALAGSLASLALLPLLSYGTYTMAWFTVGPSTFQISSLVSPVSLLLIATVLVIAPVIFLYSFGYIQMPSEQRRFYLEMLGFEAAMLTFAMSGDLVTLFIAWEFLSLMSYLLIGFWHNREKADRAARKAITIVLLGDVALFAAIVILFNVYSSVSFSYILSHQAQHTGMLYAAALLLVIAILTKSAQFPFQEWLPDAMEGPTPVSAFLHSSTMVKAGVFMLIILYPLFMLTGTLSILLALGIITAVISTLNAMKETQVKRVIAYSTVQELSLMIIAAASGALAAAVYFFLVQSFYKALLFFGAGSAMQISGKEDIREGSTLKQNRLAYFTTLFGVLSLAGFIPFSGFFAQAGLASSLSSQMLIYAFVSVIGLSTSFFIFRWLFLLTREKKKARLGYPTIPRSMVTGMAVFAFITIAISILYPNFNTVLSGAPSYLSSLLSKNPLRISLHDAVIEMLAAAIGAAISYLAYKRGASLPSLLNGIVYNSGAFNTAYSYSAGFVVGISGAAASFDQYLSEFFDTLGKATVRAGRGIRHVSSGSINIYAALLAIATIILIILVYAIGLI